MADYGIKIAKPGFDASGTPTETTKKNFIILNTVDAHKLVYADFVVGGSYTHNRGSIPFFLSFSTDGTANPTQFIADTNARAGTAQITNLPGTAYLMIFHEGG